MASNRDAGTQRAHSQPHIPRLSYRNSATGTILQRRSDSANAVPTTTVTAADSTALSSSPPSEYCPSPPSSEAVGGVQSTLSPDAVAVPDSGLSPEIPTKLSKKRGSSLLGFLSVKEPSKQAFLDYQESIRKQTAVRHGRISAVGMPGVSSARLPATVPKVNSKWDGVPQTLKEREKERKDSRRPSLLSNRLSSSSAPTLGSRHSSSRSTSFFRNKYGNPSDSSVTKLGWEAYSHSNGSGSKDIPTTPTDPGDAPLTPTLPEMTSLCPPYVSEPPKIPAQYRGKASIKVPSYIDVPPHSVSPSLTPTETSPVTPYPPSSPIGNPSLFELKPVTITEDDFNDTENLFHRFDRVTLNSNGANILAPPSTSKRRPNVHGLSAGNADHLRISSETDQPPSILKQGPNLKRSEVVARPPVSSYFPVVDPDMKRRSNATSNKHDPKLIVRNRDIAPWEWDELSINDAQDTSLTPTKQSGKANRRKKLSVFGR